MSLSKLKPDAPSGSIAWPAWMVPACLAFMTRNSPFHLLVMGPGDGQILIADYLKRRNLYSEDGKSLPGPEQYQKSPFPILSRTGLGPILRDSSQAGDLFAALSQESSGLA